MGTMILTLSRNMRRIVWVNIIFLTTVILFIFLLFAILESQKALIVASVGILAGAGNQLYLNVFKLRRVSRDLISSFENIQSELLFDDLTGMWNRRPGMKRLHEEIAAAGRKGAGLSVALMDIDNFKKVNDRYGHLAGDHILKEIGRTILEELRKTDIVIRYGGEEFLVVMPETDEKQALRPLDRLRRRLSHTEIDYRGEKIRISISIGVASLLPEPEGVPELLNRADHALLAAKSSGRNRVLANKPALLLRLTTLN